MRERPARFLIPPWLALLVGLSVLFVATVGVVPHGDEDQSCLACKARHQPIEKVPAAQALDAPPARAIRALSGQVGFHNRASDDSKPPRAPPV